MSGEQSDQKGASVHGTTERGGGGGDDVRRHHVHYIPQMMYSPTTQQPIGVVPVPISVPILEAAAAMRASRLQQQQAREKIAAEKRRERERQEMEKKVRENLRREALKSRLALLSAPEVCYNAGSRSADIYWTEVEEEQEEDGGDEKNSEAVIYLLTMQEGEVRKEVYRGPDCEHVVNGLLPGHTYTFSLIACLNDVYGSSSPLYNLAVPAEPPNRPSPPRMATKSKTAITLRWTASADNGSPLDQYKLEWDQCGGEIVEVYCGKDKQHKMQHKFPPGAVAKFRISAHNQAGWSECSDWLVYEVHVTASVPSAPSPPSLVAATINSLSLSWEEPDSKGAPITSYTLQMDDQDSGYGFKPVYQGEEREHTCSKLNRVAQYSFRVAATNSKGTGPFSSPSVFSTLPDRPGPPTDVGLSGKAHPSSFTIKWSPPHDAGGSDIDSYRLLLDDGAGGEMIEVYCGSELSYFAQGLDPGRTYRCKVSSISIGGDGTWSSIAQLTTPPIVPTCPLQLSLCGKVTATHATLQWDKPEFDGGAPVISYTVQGREIREEEAWTLFGTVANPEAFSTQAQQSLLTTLSSLAPGTRYEFRVYCANKVGSSPPSSTCQCLTAPGAPDPPAGLKLVTVSAITVVLSWQPPVDHGTPVTGYQLEHWLDTTDTQTPRKQLSVNALQATVRGLSPASTYLCRLRASSAAGHSVWTEPLSFSTTSSTPGLPRHLSVLTRTADSLLLVWASPLTHGSPVTSYILETAGRQETTTVSSSETQFTVTDLQPSTTYKFRLQAENIVGKGPFTPYVTSSTLPLPPSPPSLTLLSCSSNSLKLSWSEKTKGKSSSVAAAGHSYTLQMAAREGSSHYSTLHRGTSLGYKVQKLRPNTSHSFRIAASSESGQGVWSTPVVFMTTPNAPPPPAGLLLRLMSATECLVSWEGVEGENMSYEVQYRKSSTQDYRQVYSDVKTSCVAPAASPGSSCEARVRAMQKVTVNGKEEQLFSFFSPSVTCETPLPEEKEPVQDTSPDQITVEDSLNKQQQDSLLRSPKCISAVLMVVIVSVGVLMALLMAQFIN